MSDDRIELRLRVPKDLHDRIKTRAESVGIPLASHAATLLELGDRALEQAGHVVVPADVAGDPEKITEAIQNWTGAAPIVEFQPPA